MRGRTLSDALVIVDKSQQTTHHLAKLMLIRAGFGSKFVFIGVLFIYVGILIKDIEVFLLQW